MSVNLQDGKLDADERKTMGNELPLREILLGTSPVYGVAAASASAALLAALAPP